MIKGKMKTALLAVSLMFTSANASDNSFSISPPPISADTIMAESGKQEKFGISVMSYSSDDFDMTGLGLVYGEKNKNSSGVIFEPSVGLGYVTGDGSGDMTMVSTDLNLMLGKKIDLLTVFVGVNGSITATTIDIDTGFGTTSTSSSMYLVGGSVGAQIDFESPMGLITPFFVYKSMSGTVETDTTEVDIDMETQQLGIDVYFKSLGTSLSAMAQSDDNGDLIYFSYNWYFKK
jgi:hypothetical protein